MHFAPRVRTRRVVRPCSEIALSRKPFGIGYMYIYNFLLRMTDNMISQNSDLSSWDILYIQGNSELMVQKENIAVTAVKDLFHQYKHNMKQKLSKFRLATLTSSTFPKCSQHQ
jgi:hypothetical protein